MAAEIERDLISKRTKEALNSIRLSRVYWAEQKDQEKVSFTLYILIEALLLMIFTKFIAGR